VGRAGGHGRIEVSARRDGDGLVLAVRDAGAGDGAAAATEAPPEGIGHGVGLRSTRARLQELYGARQRLELRPDSAGGTIAEIVLPFHTSAESGVLRAAPTGGRRP
jgi:sensor histidine kinase YesM